MVESRYSGAMPYFPPEDRKSILAAIEQILVSGQMTQGPYLAKFEQACARMAGTRHAIGVNSGGTALELVLTALDVKDAEVIVPTETFIATPNSVVRAGGKPVFADISVENLAISIESLRARLTPRTRGIILVHMFGIMADQITDIQVFCKEHGLFLVEDAAHAHGATFLSKAAGSLGVAGCFSYYATKVLTTGEGGVITTDDDKLAAEVRSLRDHGRVATGTEFNRAGNNFRLAEIPAVLGFYQQGRLEEIVRHRRHIAAVYRHILGRCESVTVIDPQPHEGHSYWRYPILLEKGLDRAQVQARMAEQYQTRLTWMYNPLCHEQPFYAQRTRSRRSDFPVASDVVDRLVNLPTHMGVDRDGAVRIAEGLRAILSEDLVR